MILSNMTCNTHALRIPIRVQNHLRYTIIVPVDAYAAYSPWGAPYSQQARYKGSFPQARFTSESQAKLLGKAEEGSRKSSISGWDVLAKTSLAGMVAVNIPLLFSPQISRKAEQMLQQRLLARSAQEAETRMDKVLKHMADNLKLKQTLIRLNSFATILQLNTGYQVGINTQQPSKSLSSLSGTLYQLAMMKFPTPFMYAWSYVSSFFWFAGETNDIKNNNNPGERREWDQKRLFKALGKDRQAGAPGFFQELKSMTRFMFKDAAYALSLGPWKDLINSIREKRDWKKPQPYQTAIGAQLNIIAFLGVLGAKFAQMREKALNPELGTLKKYREFKDWPEAAKRIPNRFSKFSKHVMLFSIISYMPVLMRALQSKNEADGVLTCLGVPLITAGQVLKASLSLESLQGLFNLGGPIVNEGKRINSKKYRAQVNYLNALHDMARENPGLKAQDVLGYLQSNPKELKTMAETMGQFRVNFILNMLQAGVQQQAIQNISLADYLLPIMKMGA